MLTPAHPLLRFRQAASFFSSNRSVHQQAFLFASGTLPRWPELRLAAVRARHRVHCLQRPCTFPATALHCPSGRAHPQRTSAERPIHPTDVATAARRPSYPIKKAFAANNEGLLDERNGENRRDGSPPATPQRRGATCGAMGPADRRRGKLLQARRQNRPT